jgi:TolB-like protein/Flp pilus assembly protein TadD
MRCLRRYPDDRPRSAEAVLAELDLVPAAAPPLTPANGTADGRRVRRRGLYAAAGLMLAFGLFVALSRQQRSSTIAAADTVQVAIAVLPLVNLSGEPADAALANGVTRELTSALARSPDLRVIPSTLAAAFSDRRINVQQIADSLEVSHVLEGSFQRVGARLRMQLRLVNARDGAIRWAETYDREFAEVFRVQAEITRAVANELTVRLGTDAGSRSYVVGRLPDLAAYEWYQRGMDLTLRRTSGGLRQALDYFERAVDIDSMYAAAHAGMAFMYIQLWNESSAREQQEWFARAQDAASIAVALDDADPQALAALGAVQLASRDFSDSEATFIRALELDPGVTRGHEYLARIYMMMARPADQLERALRGVEVDPLSYSAIRELALALATNDRCEDALDQLRTLKSLEPPAGVAGVIGGMCYASRHMWPEAIAEFRWALDRTSANFALAFLGYSLARAGRLDEAAAILSDLLAGREDSHGAFGIATVYAGMLDYDAAFAWLERAVENNEVNAYIMHPVFSDLRADPRFERVRAQMGLGPPRP